MLFIIFLRFLIIYATNNFFKFFLTNILKIPINKIQIYILICIFQKVLLKCNIIIYNLKMNIKWYNYYIIQQKINYFLILKNKAC